MDDNSYHSESVCSDDTEYLLGQNVSIREIEDVEVPIQEVSINKASLKYTRHTQGLSVGKQREIRTTVRQASSKKEKNYRVSEKQHGDFKYNEDFVSSNIVRPLSPIVANLEFIEDVEKKRHKSRTLLNKQKELSKPTHHQHKRQPSPGNCSGARIIPSEQQAEMVQRGRMIKKLPMDGSQGNKPNFHSNWSPHGPTNHYSDHGYEGDVDMHTPEPADVGSIASEATEDLLQGKDDLDGSVMEKLKELNLAVNYDEQSNEFFDDKVKEGAELLSKLFGGAVDNYYSSPSLSNSGNSKNSSSPRSNSASKGEERINISNTSSKMGSYTTTNTISTAQQPFIETSKKKGKVSFATDESSSFDSSVHAATKSQRLSTTQDYGRAQREENRYHSANHSEFVRETSALRAAMDYSNESEQQSGSFGQESSPSTSLDSQRVSYPSTSPKYKQGTEKEVIHKDEGYALDPRFRVERYSKSSAPHIEIPAISPNNNRSRHEFATSTPQRNRQQTNSPTRPYQIAKEDLERKALFEKKLQETEGKLGQSIQDLRDIEFDIEEATSRRKLAIQEADLLTEQLKHAKADIKSSENLAEEYRQRATKTRSELMELEVERDAVQQEIKDLSTMLQRQKQDTAEAVQVERKNERKVMELTLERDKLLREMESSKTRLEQLEVRLKSEKDTYCDKINHLQDQLIEEQRSAKENVDRLKQQLETERQNARDSHYERIHSMHKLQDEAKEMQQKEIEAVRVRMLRERELEIEKVQEKARREADNLERKVQDADYRSDQLEKALRERESEIEQLREKIVGEKQNVYESELGWKEALEKQEAYSRALKAEVDNLKTREIEILEKQRHLEENLDDKTEELRRLDEKSFSQAEESSKILENKEDEIQMLRSLVRQQEDATRLLGEKLRNEAQEHIRSALTKERDSMDKERERFNQKLDETRQHYEDVLRQLRDDLEEERQGHRHLQNALHKMKMEMEKFRQLHLQTQEEKVNAVAQLRSESKEQINRLKDKIEELTVVTDKVERDTVLEINEECRRVANLIGKSPNTTPIRPNSSFNGESPGSKIGSPTRDALANLRSCNAELRQSLLEARKDLEIHRNTPVKTEPSSELTQQQMAFFKKTIKNKDDEIARLRRQLQEEVNKASIQSRTEKMSLQKTIDRLERELRDTKRVNSITYSPRLNGISSPQENTSGLGTSLSSNNASPRTGDDNSTTKLLRHLQGRVKQLRAQNESMRSDSLNDSQTSIYSDSVDNLDETAKTKKLQEALQVSEQRAQQNSAMLSQKMMEMTKLQKMLTHATKENMKLERAYASLQRKIIDASS
ncbi:trichohyalin isoform X2 [Nematostella vectensis]|uniref:trichohyalin isoform X2 n=1 Tax=Nematostella vectensis TaxID=45351 RepID=UPI0020774BE1|nr:trichohyalin isoform X2 [Nematostella vectensis]